MKNTIDFLLLAIVTLSGLASAQNTSNPLPNAPSSQATTSNPEQTPDASGQKAVDPPPPLIGTTTNQSSTNHHTSDLSDKFGYYMSETYMNPGALIGPGLRAGIRMANPPGKGATRYPPEWRQGAEAFGRNYGDAFAERVSFQTARFVSGAVFRENPRYTPSSSHNVLARSFHALTFTFIDRSDSGHAMPAISNFVGAAAGGFVGNAYLPTGFDNVTHAGQRATLQFGFAAGGNLFREFAPQMPTPMRNFFMLIAR